MKYMNVSLSYTLKSLKTSHSSFIMQYMTALYSELQLVLAFIDGRYLDYFLTHKRGDSQSAIEMLKNDLTMMCVRNRETMKYPIHHP